MITPQGGQISIDSALMSGAAISHKNSQNQKLKQSKGF